jgi:hypothetical protein
MRSYMNSPRVKAPANSAATKTPTATNKTQKAITAPWALVPRRADSSGVFFHT